MSAAVTANVEHDKATAWALAGGDDYQLCFTVPQAKRSALQSLIDGDQLQASVIGEVVEGVGVVCRENGVAVNFDATGYNHF